MEPIKINYISKTIIDFLEHTDGPIRIDEKIAALEAAAQTYRIIVSVESGTVMMQNMLAGKYLPGK